MLRGERRSFSDIAFDALRGVTTVVFGQTLGGMRRLPQPVVRISLDPVVLQPGEELILDKRALPEKRFISVECPCGGRTYRFTILRDYRAFLAEREGLGSYFTALKDTIWVATAWKRICLSGKCISCDKVIEAFIRFDH